MLDLERDRLMPILADLLMGAAHADQQLDGREKETIRARLATFLELDELPPQLDARLEAYDPATVDPRAVAAELGPETPDRKRKILELVAAVHDADDQLDLDEDAYLRDLAQAMGLDASQYSDLQLEILSIEELRDELRALVATPPPIPKK